ncbi:hypothetical protein F9K94_04835 [Brucella tritici]|uniref:Uncharacterized protein n=1 Tax=Brucella tritici TaxID=94626 RepID=A0A7V7VYI4_9HYPH|nr:hypothetical protein [Brucella tritici]KAB2659514.1 hypothetical protein F9K94_04835 [Brucella tritici]
MLIEELARHRRSKLSVTLANRKKAAPVRKHLSGKLFHDKANIAGFRQKERALFLHKEKGGRNRLFLQFQSDLHTTVANSSGRGEKSDFRVPERSVLEGT